MIEINKISKDDLEDLSILLEELSMKKTNVKQLEQTFEKIQSSENYYLLGAKLEGKLVGSIMGIICYDLVGDCKPFMVIENVIVADNHRGYGIGKELMKEIESIGRQNNCYYVMFVSGYQRKRAHKFYESMGYKLDEVQGFRKYL